MIRKFYLNFLNIFIDIVDKKNKLKINNYFLSKFKNRAITLVDVGAHKGETINLFLKNFNIKKIYSFEPNPLIFKELKKKIINNKIKMFNIGLSNKKENKILNIFFDTASSTINQIDKKSSYYKRKKKIFSPGYNEVKFKKIKIFTNTLSNIMKSEKINKVDILKIDTEGYELKVLKGIIKKDFKKIKFIYFEHHYDLMIKKFYKYSDIDNLLKKNKFKKKFKIKMSFRKTFEYIYEKK